jgi:Transposase domain (DUF772)
MWGRWMCCCPIRNCCGRWWSGGAGSFAQTGRAVLTEGRPTVALETVVRLMVLKQRYRWGYRTLVAEVSDSIHLRRLCRISLTERVPDESTIRKLTRWIGSETVSELTRALIVMATRERRFRPRAVRIDSTVIEADVRYRTDAGWLERGQDARAGGAQARQADRGEEGAGARSLAVDGCQVAGDQPDDPPPLGRGQGGGADADRGNRSAVGALGQRGSASRGGPRRKARGRGAKAKLKAAAALEEMADRREKVASQIRPAGRRKADQGSAGIAVRSGCPADPQGQAGQAQPRPIARLSRDGPRVVRGVLICRGFSG